MIFIASDYRYASFLRINITPHINNIFPRKYGKKNLSTVQVQLSLAKLYTKY